jgi:hypothetical protein
MKDIIPPPSKPLDAAILFPYKDLSPKKAKAGEEVK